MSKVMMLAVQNSGIYKLSKAHIKSKSGQTYDKGTQELIQPFLKQHQYTTGALVTLLQNPCFSR